MAEPDNIVLEHLRAIRAKLDEVDRKIDRVQAQFERRLAGLDRRIDGPKPGSTGSPTPSWRDLAASCMPSTT